MNPLNRAISALEEILEIVRWGGEADRKDMLVAAVVRDNAKRALAALETMLPHHYAQNKNEQAQDDRSVAS